MSSQRQAITGIQGDMMSAYANTLQKPDSFDKYVRKFRSICVMHGVQIGSRMELPGFLRKLMDDRHLAMDFWAFIGKVSDREGGELSDDQMLGVVIEGITDAEISEVGGGHNRTVDDLRAMLAGVDIQGPEPSPVEMAPFPRSEAVLDRGEERLWTDPPEPSAAPSNPHVRFASDRAEEIADHSAVLPTTPAPQLDEALLRLELARLVQQYFDNIDKRISKLEPHPEGEPPTGTIAPAVTRRSLEEPTTASEMEELRLRRMGRTRLILEPIASPVEEPLEARDDRPIRIPLEHYSPPSRFGAAPTLLVLVLIGAAFAIYHDPTILRHGFAVVVRLFRTDDAASATNSRTSQSGPTESRPADQEASPSNEQRQPTAAQPPVERTPSSPPADTPNQAVESQPPSNHVDSGSGHFADRAVAETGQAIEAGISSIEAAGAVNVNPSVMNRNLLVSRVPAYPEFAKMSRIEGDVVMQALISKQGTVKRVHVTEGDSRLRSAAEEAVYKWRYRPYVLNGQPVEVATTVTVNFALNR